MNEIQETKIGSVSTFHTRIYTTVQVIMLLLGGKYKSKMP